MVEEGRGRGERVGEGKGRGGHGRVGRRREGGRWIEEGGRDDSGRKGRKKKRCGVILIFIFSQRLTHKNDAMFKKKA